MWFTVESLFIQLQVYKKYLYKVWLFSTEVLNMSLSPDQIQGYVVVCSTKLTLSPGKLATSGCLLGN